MNKQLVTPFTSITHTAFVFILLGIQIVLSSCNISFLREPGPQVSSTVEYSKSCNTFICAYKINGNRINGCLVNSIFAEKKYWLGKGFFRMYNINCCQSQLVIVYDTSLRYSQVNNIPENWEYIYTDVYVKYYDGVTFPDTIHIKVRPNVKDSTVVNDFILYKIKKD